MFRTWVVALCFGQMAFNEALALRWRWACGLVIAAALYVSWTQERAWISGWLPPLVAVAVMAWLGTRKRGLTILVVTIGIVLTMSVVVYWVVNTQEQQYSTASRVATWPIMLDMIRASPLIGLGPANYYHYTPLYSLWGWRVYFNSHNNFIDIIAQTGLVGLGAFAWLVFELARAGWRMQAREGGGFSHAYITATLGGLAGTLAAGFMGDWFLPFTYNIGFAGFRAAIFPWLFLGGLLALEHIGASRGDNPGSIART